MKARGWSRTIMWVGLAGLLLGVGVLVKLFIEERSDAKAQGERERSAIHALARHGLEEALERAFATIEDDLRVAREVPLDGRGDLFEATSGHVIYPLVREPRGQSRLGAWARATGGEPADGGWDEDAQERWRLAMGAGADLEPWLDHRTRFVIPADLDAVSAVVAVEQAASRGLLTPARAAALLREGEERDDGRAAGVLGTILAARERFSGVDFEQLVRRATAVGRRLHVRVDDFERSAGLSDHGTLLLAATSTLGAGRRIIDLGAAHGELRWWAVEVTGQGGEGGGGRIVGRRLEPDWMEAIGARLVAAELVEVGTEFALTVDGRSIDIASPRWERAAHDADRRFVLKLLPAGLIALLGGTVTALAFTLQRRREAYIGLRASLLTAVSHELKTPLASIRAMAETLERRLGDDSRARDYPQRIVRSSERLSFLVDNILSFARLDREAWRLDRSVVPVVELIARVRERAEAMAPRGEQVAALGRARFTISVDPADLALECDADLVALLLANLVDNSMKYTKGDDVAIAISARPVGDEVAIVVADDGPGLEVGDPERFFEALARGERAHVKGTGLGLTLCRLIATLHRGHIRLLPTDGRGCAFEVVLPAPGERRAGFDLRREDRLVDIGDMEEASSGTRTKSM